MRALATEAAAALRRSAAHALDRSNFDGAVRFLERAVGLAQGEELGLALVELGELYEQIGSYRESIAVLDRFFAMPEAASMPGPRVRGRVFAMISRQMTEPDIGVQAGVRAAQELLGEAESTGDPYAIRAAVIASASMAFFSGRCAEARAIGARLLPEAKSLSPIYRDHVCFTIGPDAYFGSVPVSEGYALIDQMRDILGDSPVGTIRCDALLAGLTAMRGDEEGFLELSRRVTKTWEELGNPSNRHFMGQGWAESAWILGRPGEAEERMREVKAALDERGESGNNSTVTAELGMFLAQTGRFDEAADLVEEARAFTAADDFGATVPIGWVDALLASVRGDHDTAMATIDEAVATVRATDYLNFTAETLRIRGQVLWVAGRTEEASSAFDEAAAVWTRKENVASLRLMQRWRDEHGAS